MSAEFMVKSGRPRTIRSRAAEAATWVIIGGGGTGLGMYGISQEPSPHEQMTTPWGTHSSEAANQSEFSHETVLINDVRKPLWQVMQQRKAEVTSSPVSQFHTNLERPWSNYTYSYQNGDRKVTITITARGIDTPWDFETATAIQASIYELDPTNPTDENLLERVTTYPQPSDKGRRINAKGMKLNRILYDTGAPTTHLPLLHDQDNDLQIAAPALRTTHNVLAILQGAPN